MTFKNKAATDILKHVFGGKKPSFLFGIYPGVELLGHSICVHSVLIDTATFPKKLPIYTSTSNEQGFHTTLFKWTSKSVINVASREYSIYPLIAIKILIRDYSRHLKYPLRASLLDISMRLHFLI